VVTLENGKRTLRLDGRSTRIVQFDYEQYRQFDHGYALTSHSSQGLTATRVLAHIDTDSPRNLINNRLAYVAISSASQDARIYTSDRDRMISQLTTDITKSAAIEIHSSKVESEIQMKTFAKIKGPNHPGEEMELHI
jgi:ATP-dependent exoDNAse (exonuclease V) alpha subunit